jgi:hypothetical protein
MELRAVIAKPDELNKRKERNSLENSSGSNEERG